MPRRIIPAPAQYDGDTRGQILDVAIKFFALKGFKAVTLKEIAKEVGIKIASLYYYYENKDALIEDALARSGEAHDQYNRWLRAANAEAGNLNEVMDNLFNEHFLTGLSPVTRLGMAMTLKEQHNHETAFQAAMSHLYSDAIQTVQEGFDRMVAKGAIPPSDTKTLAALYMFCVMSVNDVHIHEAAETEMPVKRTEIYNGLRMLLDSALTAGTLKSAGQDVSGR